MKSSILTQLAIPPILKLGFQIIGESVARYRSTIPQRQRESEREREKRDREMEPHSRTALHSTGATMQLCTGLYKTQTDFSIDRPCLAPLPIRAHPRKNAPVSVGDTDLARLSVAFKQVFSDSQSNRDDRPTIA